MAAASVFASATSDPGGTGSTLTVTLSTHAADDYLIFFVENTGNTLWAGNPTDWTRIDQRAVGNSSNGIVQTWFWKKAVSSSETNPVCTLGATVTRGAICWTVRGADLEGAFSLPEWGARGFATGTGNPVRPPSVTTLAPEMLVLIGYGSRAATTAPVQTDYSQDQVVIISGTLVLQASERTVADPQTALSNQDASPTSGARWAAGILCIPSPDYVYYRSGSQAVQANNTLVTGALPAGTSSSDTSGRKDLIIVTAQAAGNNIDIQPSVPADWTPITGFSTNTSGNGTTVRKWWALYDGSISLGFTRPTAGEIAVCITTYRNCDQTNPIGGVNVQQNTSSTTSAWPALTRTETKSTVTATCVADGTPSYTVTAMTERMDGNGITCADRIYGVGGTVPSASFTLSTASPTACGLVELLSHAGVTAQVQAPRTMHMMRLRRV